MSNIKKLAPYVYLAKRNDGSGKYDLFLLVPVGQSMDTNLTNAEVSTEDPKRIIITYPTSTNNANVIYRTRRFDIVGTEDLAYVEVRDESANYVMKIEVSDADEVPGNPNSDQQTFAPYLFTEIDNSGQKVWLNYSCIILSENGLTVANETMAQGKNYVEVSFDIESNNSALQPENFNVNKKIKAELTAEELFTVNVTINGNNNYNKPPRTTKNGKIWHT